MPLTVGQHEVEIIRNSLRIIGDKEVVSLQCRLADGDDIEVVIWLTERAKQIARKSLAICGFSVDEEDLERLDEEPELLEGHRITVLAQEFNGRMRAQILLNATPTKKRIRDLQSQLRAAKQGDEDDIPF